MANTTKCLIKIMKIRLYKLELDKFLGEKLSTFLQKLRFFYYNLKAYLKQ